MWNGFYDLKDLDTNQLKQLMKRSYELSYDSHVDILKGFSRERYNDISVDEYIENYVDDSTHNVLINRKAYFHMYNHGEVGSTTITNILGKRVSLYLFIYISLEDLDKIVKEFNLERKLLK